MLIFGGADREQCHFNDCVVYRAKKNSSIFEATIAHGDIPMERSGHQTTAYGKYQFLFGGINFTEESVFNDLYILNTGYYRENFSLLSLIKLHKTCCYFTRNIRMELCG